MLASLLTFDNCAGPVRVTPRRREPRATLLHPECIVLGLKAAGAMDVLDELAWRVARQENLDFYSVFEAVSALDAVVGSAMGGGIALPNASLGELRTCVGAFARLVQPVSFSGPAHRPVDLVFLLLGPTSPIYRARLRNLIRRFVLPGVSERLRHCRTEHAVQNILDVA